MRRIAENADLYIQVKNLDVQLIFNTHDGLIFDVPSDLKQEHIDSLLKMFTNVDMGDTVESKFSELKFRIEYSLDYGWEKP